MMVHEILDRAASLAKSGHTVLIVASGPSQREVLRNGIRRRLDPADLERVHLLVSITDAMGRSFDHLLVTDEVRQRVRAEDRAFVEQGESGTDEAAEGASPPALTASGTRG